MKQIFTLFLLGVIAISINGQNSGNYLLNQHDKLQGRLCSKLPDRIDKSADIKLPALRQFSIYRGNKPGKHLAIMQQMDSYEYQEYDATNSQWVNSSLDEFTYDSYGQNTSDILSTWNSSSGMYEQVSKQEFTYDVNGNITTEIYYSWDIASSQWEYYLKWEYTYNSEGVMTLGYSYTWDINTSQWLVAGKDEVTYNSNRNVVLEINYWWDSTTNEWMNSSKTENEYNTVGKVSISTYFMWDMVNNQWMNNSRTEYTYDSGGFLTLEKEFAWNEGTSQWENDYKYEYTFDENMNMTMSLYSEWNGAAWIINEKDELTYNNAYTYNQLILPWYFDQTTYEFGHMLTGITEYDGSSLVLSAKSIFNYSEVNLTGLVETTPKNRALIFPQPAEGLITFTWENNNQFLDLKVYDVNQKLILNHRIENNRTVNIAQLTPGLYFYKLTWNQNTIYTGKLSVR